MKVRVYTDIPKFLFKLQNSYTYPLKLSGETKERVIDDLKQEIGKVIFEWLNEVEVPFQLSTSQPTDANEIRFYTEIELPQINVKDSL